VNEKPPLEYDVVVPEQLEKEYVEPNTVAGIVIVVDPLDSTATVWLVCETSINTIALSMVLEAKRSPSLAGLYK
jgi:hypothetical protein